VLVAFAGGVDAAVEVVDEDGAGEVAVEDDAPPEPHPPSVSAALTVAIAMAATTSLEERLTSFDSASLRNYLRVPS
jgi:hypothetical protein